MSLRRYVTLIEPSSGAATDLVIEADGNTPAAEIRALLESKAPAPGPIYLGTEALPDAGVFQVMGLQDGALLGCGAPVQAARITSAAAVPELHLVGGPMAGRVQRIQRSRFEVGRASENIGLHGDDMVSRRHLEIRLDGEESELGRSAFERGEQHVSVVDLGSANGTEVEGSFVVPGQAKLVSSTDLIRAGNTLLRIVRPTTPDIPLVFDPDGTVGLNRRFRTGEDGLDTEVEMPHPPSIGERPSLNLLLTIFPALAIGAIAIALGQLHFLIFAAIGPIGGVGSALVRRRSHTRRERAAKAEYDAALEAAQQRIAVLRTSETQRLRAALPDPAAVVQCARAGGRWLWAMRPGEADFLRVRVGCASRPSAVAANKAERESLWMVPAGLDLATVGGIAITGDVGRARGTARSMVLQGAVFRAPSELKIVVLGSADSESSWSWTRWLPHCRWESDEPFALVGSDPSSVGARLAELRDLIKRRQDHLLQRRDSSFVPAVLVVYDEVSNLLPDAADILREGPTVGVYAVTIDAQHVPDGCNASVSLGTEGDDSVIEQAGVAPVRDVLADEVAPTACELVARCLAPMKLIGEAAAAELPQQLRLLDVLGIDGTSSTQIADLWRQRSRQMSTPVGVSRQGTLEIDLTRDGPHGIVAGMSRSGKSEFLKTLIGSLAATNHPDDLAFLFIDFKGGNDYRLAAQLPHTVDLATQLDSTGFERALRLLDAELGRRQQLAGTLHASTIEGYWAAQAQSTTPTTTLPRLLVIADEFAELVQRNPEQIERLVSVARLGAAYGVHLLLATQQPSGVVSAQIDANAPLRVCFRTADTQQSTEILGSAEAAAIVERHRGRGYKRAHGAPPTEFQCARVGNARPGTSAAAPPSANPWTWAVAGRIPPDAGRIGEVPDPETDLADLVAGIRDAAAASGWHENAVPWPKTLPAIVPLESLPLTGDAIPFAVADDPDQQATVPLPIVLGGGPVGLAGAPGSGRTTALRTLAVSAAQSFSVRDLHVYVIDYRGSGLGVLRQLPHTGGVSNADPEVAARIVEHLEQELRVRRGAFDTSGASSLDEHNRSLPTEDRLPWLLLLVNGWEVLHEDAQTAAGSAQHDRLIGLLSSGSRFGLQVVIAGDRWAASGRAGRVMGQRLSLRFEVDSDYDAVGVPLRAIPSAMPPGRAITPDGLLAHIAVLHDGSGAGEASAVQQLAGELVERDAPVAEDHRPRRIVPLPARLPIGEIQLIRPAEQLPLLLGMSSETSSIRWIDLAAEGRSFVVSGRRRSGRSTTLVAMGRAAIDNGVHVIAFTPKPSPLADLVGATVVERDGFDRFDLNELHDVGPTLVLLDDVDLLDPTHSGFAALTTAIPAGVGIVAAGASTPIRMQASGFVATMRRSRYGMVLCPESGYDAGTFGAPNFDGELVFAGPPGRAVVGLAGELDIVQVPEP